MLTKKQHSLLLLIHDQLKENGIAPSFEEMKVALELKSKSGIHRLINALEERGFIRRLANRARAIEIIKMPDDDGNGDANIFKPNFASNRQDNDPNTIEIPLHGKIAAGTPMEALEQYENIGVPKGMLGAGSYYALDVDGDSMMEAGILDGDRVVIERCDQANSGQIVVALVDEEEATLKTLRRQGPDVALEPSNRAFKTQVFPANRVRIQGRLVGLLREY
jgi:repressor LexA